MGQQFAVGDRVIVVNEQAIGLPRGTMGTVVRAFVGVPDICDVQFDGVRIIRAVLTNALASAPRSDAAPPDKR